MPRSRELLTLATRAIPRMALRRENTALVVQDMQRYFADPEGGYARVAAERGISFEYEEFFRIIGQMKDNVRTLVDRCHELGIPVLYTTFAYEDERDISPLQVGMGIVLDALDPEAEIIDAVGPQFDEPVYAKTGFSAFTSWDFADHLARRGTENLICTGLHTEFGVWATAQTAQDLGMRPLLVSDGCAGLSYTSHGQTMSRAPHALTRVRSTGELLTLLAGMDEDEPVLI